MFPDNIGTMKTVDSKVNVVGSQLSIIDTDFADTIVKYTDVSEFLTLKDQVDGQLSLWFYSGVPSTDTAPTVNWVTEDAKRLHIGDLYYDMKADDAYRWTDTFIWETLSDKNLLKVLRAASLENDTANGSRRVFSQRLQPHIAVVISGQVVLVIIKFLYVRQHVLQLKALVELTGLWR